MQTQSVLGGAAHRVRAQEDLLREAEVAVVPGTAFGEHGANHVRASFSTSYENLVEATDRIARFRDSLMTREATPAV